MIEFFVIVEIINMMSGVFSYIYVMTNGGPGFASQVLEYYIWQNVFAFRQGGIAATTAVLLLAVTAVVIFLQFRSSCVASSPEPSSRNGHMGPT